MELKDDKPLSAIGEKANTLERRLHTARNEKGDNNTEVLIAQLNNRVSNSLRFITLSFPNSRYDHYSKTLISITFVRNITVLFPKVITADYFNLLVVIVLVWTNHRR